MRRDTALWEAFRRGDERGVMQHLRDREELRHIGGELPLRAACWYGMEHAAMALIETWAAPVSAEHPDIARRRGHEALALWLENEIKTMQSLIA
jgi:hypothetical protein